MGLGEKRTGWEVHGSVKWLLLLLEESGLVVLIWTLTLKKAEMFSLLSISGGGFFSFFI